MHKLTAILEGVLNERTYRINTDVDYVYRRSGFDQMLVKPVQRGDYSKIRPLLMSGKDSLFVAFSSIDLPSSTAKRCHLANPVSIRCGVTRETPFYQPKTGIVNITPHRNALEAIVGGTVQSDDKLERMLSNEITEHRLKGIIYHELAHWMDDTLHNRHLSKLFKASEELNDIEMTLLGKKDVGMTHFEIEAQVHQIKQLKRSFKNEWDSMSLEDVFYKIPSLMGIHGKVSTYGMDVSKIWQKQLMKRMHREGLLGKKMRHFVW